MIFLTNIALYLKKMDSKETSVKITIKGEKTKANSVYKVFLMLNDRVEKEEIEVENYEKQFALYNRLIRSLSPENRKEVSLVLRDLISLYEKTSGCVLPKNTVTSKEILIDESEETISTFNLGNFPEKLRAILYLCLSEYIFT